MTIPTTITNLGRCWDSLEALLAGLTDEQWATPSLCPGWTVRDVVVHLGSIEHMMLGEAPGAFGESIPFQKAADWMGEVAELDHRELRERFGGLVAARRRELAGLGADDLAVASLTPVGPGTYGRFLAVRVFDFWVHEQDIRQPLGLFGHEGGPAAEMAIDEIDRSLGYIVGKKIGLPDGMSITIEIDGPVQRAMHVAVTGRATVVAALDRPDVTLRTDSTTFALLACGRIDPQVPIDAGRVSWSGDDAWGEVAARNLAFTM
ncbi:MAG TPA: maleylpyruvate isomerase family mycothiol-dependent enzyme [Ilumatobacter sp.]